MVSEKFDPLQQKANQIAVENTVIIVKVTENTHPDDNFLEEVAGEFQGVKLGGFLLLRAHLEGGLDIQLPVAMINGEIDLFLDIATIPTVHHNAHIYIVFPTDQIAVDDVFYEVTGIVLPMIKTRISQTNVGVVIFVGLVEVGLVLVIITLGHADQESIDGMIDIGGYQSRVGLFIPHRWHWLHYQRAVFAQEGKQKMWRTK